MAEFLPAFEHVMKNEGGYVSDPVDPGGETYRGIARRRNPKWCGWVRIDILKQQRGFPANLESDARLQHDVADLYEINYWHALSADAIESQAMATSIFDFGVNAGPATSARLAQLVCDARADGVIGQESLQKLNDMQEELFLARFALSKAARYIAICERRPQSRKFFFGWIRRTLEGV